MQTCPKEVCEDTDFGMGVLLHGVVLRWYIGTISTTESFLTSFRRRRREVGQRSVAGWVNYAQCISIGALAWISLAEFTHPVIASLDLPSLPQAVKRAEASFYFFFSPPLSVADEERSTSVAKSGESTVRNALALISRAAFTHSNNHPIPKKKTSGS